MKFIEPMLAQAASERLRFLRTQQKWADDYVGEPKLDGFRGQLHIEAGKLMGAFSRIGTDNSKAQGLQWLHKIKWPKGTYVLDCEWFSGSGINLDGPAAATAKASGNLNVAVFDYLDEKMKETPWHERRAKLEKMFGVAPMGEGLSLTPYTMEHAKLWKEWVTKRGGEGVMLKHVNSKYIPGWRSPYWLKEKVLCDIDVVIMGWTDKADYSREKYKSAEAGAIYGLYINNQLTEIGRGTLRGKIVDLEKAKGKVYQMTCNGMLPSGALRNPRLPKLREDKKPADCTLESQIGKQLYRPSEIRSGV